MWQRFSNCASFPAANRFKQFKIYSTAFIEFVYLGWVLNHATEAAKRCWHFACKARSPSEGILHRSTLCWSWPKLHAFPFFGITVASNTNCAKRPGASWVWIWFDPWLNMLNSIQQRCIFIKPCWTDLPISEMSEVVAHDTLFKTGHCLEGCFTSSLECRQVQFKGFQKCVEKACPTGRLLSDTGN